MSTQSCTTSNPYSIPLVRYYTGTNDQPDNVSIFYKNENGEIQIKDEEFANSLGHNPSNMSTAALRIRESVKEIFKEINLGFSRKESDLWNAFKNLGRALVQLVPFLGNATLYVLDYFRTNFYFHPQVKAALASENNSVLGFAFDGKVVAQFSKEEFNTCLKNASSADTNDTLDDPLVTLEYIWTETVIRELHNNNSTLTRLELAQDLERRIKAGSVR